MVRSELEVSSRPTSLPALACHAKGSNNFSVLGGRGVSVKIRRKKSYYQLLFRAINKFCSPVSIQTSVGSFWEATNSVRCLEMEKEKK